MTNIWSSSGSRGFRSVDRVIRCSFPRIHLHPVLCQSPPTQIIASISPPSTVGRHALTTRFTARVRIHSMSYPNKDAMQTIFTQMLERVRARRTYTCLVI